MNFKKMSVDAGCFAAIDAAVVEKFGGKIDETKYSAGQWPSLTRFVAVEKPGRYFVSMKATGQRLGRSGYVEVTRTKLGACGVFVGDPCYLFGNKEWDAFLASNNTLNDLGDTGILYDLGGDGEYGLSFTIQLATPAEVA